MDIEDLIYYLKSEKNKSVARIEEKYKNYTSTNCKRIKLAISDKIKGYFHDINFSKVEKYLDDNFFTPIMSHQKNYVGEIDSLIHTMVSSISRDLEESREESRINNTIDETIIEINRTNLFKHFNEYMNECISCLGSYILYSYQSPLYSRSQIENLYYTLEDDLRKYMTSEINKLTNSMNTETEKELYSLSSNYKNQIHEFRNQNKSNALESEYKTVIEMAGLSLVKENDKMYIVDQNNNYHELEENRRTTDNQYNILSNNIGEYSIADFSRNISIISDSLTTRIINKETNERIKIEYGFDGYEFMINEKKIEDKQGRKDFINMLYQNYPGVYRHLCSDPFLGKECIDTIAEINKPNVSANAAMFISDFKKNTESMLNELDQNEQAFITEEEKSLDDEIFELEQNPLVQRYLELKRIQEEQQKKEQDSQVLKAVLL